MYSSHFKLNERPGLAFFEEYLGIVTERRNMEI